MRTLAATTLSLVQSPDYDSGPSLQRFTRVCEKNNQLKLSARDEVCYLGLPSHEYCQATGQVLGGAAKPNVGAVAIAKFQRLVVGDRDRGGASQTRVRLFCDRVFYAVPRL